MRIDRLTSKLQLALSDSQSLAVGMDHPAIEPLHLMQALIDQQGGSIKPLLMQVGLTSMACVRLWPKSWTNCRKSRIPRAM